MAMYGYVCKLTTNENLKQQINALRSKGLNRDHIYEDKMPSLYKGDTLVVTDLNVLGPSLRQVLEVIRNLCDKGIKINVINRDERLILDDSPTGRLVMDIIESFVKLQHEIMSARINHGIVKAKKSNPNYKAGRPKRKLDKRNLDIYYYSTTHTIPETARKYHVSTSTVSNIRKQFKKEMGDM